MVLLSLISSNRETTSIETASHPSNNLSSNKFLPFLGNFGKMHAKA
jgi:hypothetical protein